VEERGRAGSGTKSIIRTVVSQKMIAMDAGRREKKKRYKRELRRNRYAVLLRVAGKQRCRLGWPDNKGKVHGQSGKGIPSHFSIASSSSANEAEVGRIERLLVELFGGESESRNVEDSRLPAIGLG